MDEPQLKTKFTKIASFQPKQLTAWYELMKPQTKYLLFGGSMSGGKSYLLRWSAVGLLLYYYRKYRIEGVAIGLFSEDYPTLKDRQVSRIQREFPAWLGKVKDSAIDGLCFQLAPEYGSGKILLRNLDDPSKYMSTEFAAEFIEELTRNNEQTFMDLRNRLRYPGIDEVKFMGATNPGGVGHGWVKKYFIDKNSGDREQDRFFYVHANAHDNKFISPEYIKQLESLPEQQRKAYLEGSWDVFAGQYFTEFNRTQHVINPFIPSKDLIIGGLDWGRTKPFAFYLSTVSKVYHTDIDGDTTTFFRVKTFCEVYGTEKNPHDWSDVIKKQIERFKLTLEDVTFVQADPSIFNKSSDLSDSIRDQFYASDNMWRILKPGSNDRIPGWQIMHKWLSLAPDGKPYWQITSNCAELIRTLPELIHDELDVEDVESTRRRGIDDDAGDACRYMLKSLKWIEGVTGQIKPKEETPKGHAAKFYGSNENANQMLLNLNKFK